MDRRQVKHDGALGVDAVAFQDVERHFPNHVHSHYVIGLMDEGGRTLTCRDQDQTLSPGDILLLGPGVSHRCDGQRMSYRALLIGAESMDRLGRELAGLSGPPVFSAPVVRDGELFQALSLLHTRIWEDAPLPEREEQLALAMSLLLARCDGSPPAAVLPPGQVELVRAYLEEHWAEPVSLDDLCRVSAMSRSALLRAFSRKMGIPPYRYLQSLRVEKAKALLAQGLPTAEAALGAGFSDQSHFTRYFTQFIGIPPGAWREEREE